jgi:N-acetylglucosaminyl-diphospho-decaprenol L-rhamnosyltransferase
MRDAAHRPARGVEPLARLDEDARREQPQLPGSPVRCFVACGAVARRSAVLDCRGFHVRYEFGREEELLALDLAAAGWELAYVEDVVAHHEPASGPRSWHGQRELRNRVWSGWLRRPLPRAIGLTGEVAARHGGDGVRALLAALPGIPWVVRERRVVPPDVERSLRLLEEAVVSSPTAGRETSVARSSHG